MQGVTKKCRLSWLPIEPSYMIPNAGGGRGLRGSANEYSCAHGAQINFGDLTPYLTYGRMCELEYTWCLTHFISKIPVLTTQSSPLTKKHRTPYRIFETVNWKYLSLWLVRYWICEFFQDWTGCNVCGADHLPLTGTPHCSHPRNVHPSRLGLWKIVAIVIDISDESKGKKRNETRYFH